MPKGNQNSVGHNSSVPIGSHNAMTHGLYAKYLPTDTFIDDAKVSFSRWNGRFINYYGENGSTYVDIENKVIKMPFKKDKYDSKIKVLLEVMLKHEE